jgi:hypothetical protein
MCSSKPKIPSNKTPVAPPAPEPGPGNLTIGNEREQLARSRGLTIPTRPDLSGLGNQEVGTATRANQFFIRPTSSTAVTGTQIDEALAAQVAAEEARQRNRSFGRPDLNRGRRR